MTKQEFLTSLRIKLSGLPRSEIEERLNFYGEMIDDRMEEGLSEREAVLAIGSADSVALSVLRETSTVRKEQKSEIANRRMKWWEILLLALGSPIWLSLLIAMFAVIISAYAVVWALVVSVWAVFAALIGCAVGCLGFSVLTICQGMVAQGIAMFAASLVCAGLGIFLLFGCISATKGTVELTRASVGWIQKFFHKGGLYHA